MKYYTSIYFYSGSPSETDGIVTSQTPGAYFKYMTCMAKSTQITLVSIGLRQTICHNFDFE